MIGKVKVGLVQLRSSADVASNLRKVEHLIRSCVRDGEGSVRFVCIPEAFDYIGERFQRGTDQEQSSRFKQSNPEPEALDGPRIQGLCSLARELGIWLSLGGFHEAGDSPSSPAQYNAHVIIDSSGSIVANYRKIHLFDTLVEGGYRESKATRPGEQLVMVENTPIGHVGLTVCYDLRFPAVFAALRKAGAEVILVPSAFTTSTGRAGHWHILLQARAIETQSYIIAPAQSGRHNATRQSFGHSLVVDPWGQVVTDMRVQEDAWSIAEIDHARIRQVRSDMPVLHHSQATEHILETRVHRIQVVRRPFFQTF